MGVINFGQGKHTIYLVGPCIVAGSFVDEEDSLGACLYKELKKYDVDYNVKCIFATDENIITFEKIMKSLTLFEEDVVIMIDFHVYFENNIGKERKDYFGDININKILNHRHSDWFWDVPIHTNQKGNIEVAKAIVENYLSGYLERGVNTKTEQVLVQQGEVFFAQNVEEEIEKYLIQVREPNRTSINIGAIVMNCNPMTKGHQYLIEAALNLADFIYVFLVEEDKSEWSFCNRMAMVKAVTKKYNNVKVIPSGKFILSYETMPIYFEKSQRQTDILDAALDLKIFGSRIVPDLKIKMRFVGEEPDDKITRQYNESMKKILPIYGVEVIEVPRLKMGKEVISASTVRKCIKENRMDVVSRFMPREAYNILESLYLKEKESRMLRRKRMYVRDYDFITRDIGVLFQKEIIIYGAGNFGRKTAIFLENAMIGISCFCDGDDKKLQFMEYPVISIKELKVKTQKEDCLIVVASEKYREEIVKDLEEEGIHAYICTWFALIVGIKLNITDNRFLPEVREQIARKKRMNEKFNDAFPFQWNWFDALYNQSDAVLIYQPEKVGSMTIKSSLDREGVESIHVHNIITNCCGENQVLDEQIAYFKETLMKRERRNRKLKIITLVRDPLARALSAYMQGFGLTKISKYITNNLSENAKEYVIWHLENDIEFSWFDNELRELTGIDIFTYPFDKMKGYTWIKEKDVEILVLKTEKMNDNENIVGEFVGKQNLKYKPSNIGQNKHYKYIYEALLKQFRIPISYVKSQYVDNQKFNHFYSEEEKKEFWQKWRDNIEFEN